MKNSILIFAAAIVVVAIFSCSGKRMYEHDDYKKKDSLVKDQYMYDSIAKMEQLMKEEASSIDSVAKAQTGTFSKFEKNTKGRKFIRTANLKFKVTNVIKSTYAIEDLTAEFGGFVTYTNLRTNINNVNTIPISRDSSLETTNYVVENEIVIRVPNDRLDSLLKEISNLINFLDYRVIKADDITLMFISNQMRINRLDKFDKRVTNAIDKRGKKLVETTGAEESLLDKQNQTDATKIESMSLQEQVEFSTINLNIYQRPITLREKIENAKNIEAYKPNLGKRITEALFQGWKIMEALIVFTISIWWLFLLFAIGYIIFRIVKKRK